MKREKTGGRQKGTRNKANLFNADTIEQAKANIMQLVNDGDIDASKLVLSYSMAKPAQRKTGALFKLEELIAQNQIEDRTRNERYYAIQQQREDAQDRLNERFAR